MKGSRYTWHLAGGVLEYLQTAAKEALTMG